MHSLIWIAFLFNLGDHVATQKILGNKATIPPPIALCPVILNLHLTHHKNRKSASKHSTFYLTLVKICFFLLSFSLIGEKKKEWANSLHVIWTLMKIKSKTVSTSFSILPNDFKKFSKAAFECLSDCATSSCNQL
jgi:hypothetical protein